MIIIEVNNNTCRLLGGPLKERDKVYNAMKVKNPDAFHLRKFMPRGWDGKFEFIKKSGIFETGLLPRVVDTAKQLKIKVEFMDNRADNKFLKKAKVRTQLKDNWKLRDYQAEGIKIVVGNNIKDIVFPRGMLKIATNGGKTIASAGLYQAYKQPTVFIMNSRELFTDALRDIPKMLNCKVGYIGNGKVVMGDFMICMVKSLQNKIKKDPIIKKWLSTVRVGIWDEGDLANNKTNRDVMKYLYNCIVRVGLSGSFNVGKKANGDSLKKDLMKNWQIEELFGAQLYEVTNRNLIDRGISSEVRVKFLRGNKIDYTKTIPYQEQLEEGIFFNRQRNNKIIKRIVRYIKKGNKHQLIIVQRHKHIEKLYPKVKKKINKLYPNLTVDWVHHKRKDRYQVTEAFRTGKLNILIGSMIIKRGKNFPLMNYMLNAGGGKSPENIIQLLGRAFRGCKIYEDFWDEGFYLKKHSRKRYVYYKAEKIEVINKYK